MKNIITAILLVFAIQVVSAQKNSTPEGDFEFTVATLPDLKATFGDKWDYFYFNKGKKDLKINLTQEPILFNYLVDLANNKKFKLNALDILFIEQGVQNWKQERKKIGFVITETGLGIKILKEGDGELPKKGDNVKVHYTGTLLDGKKFDSSVDRGEPFVFSLGQGQVIKGWDEGISKLKVGSKAILRIPAELGYGSREVGGVIPANSTLVFEVELLGIE